MNGEIPGTGRFTPGGSGGAGTAAWGKRIDAWARDTFLRVASDRPPTSPTAAAATPALAATRNCRRAVGPARPAGVHRREAFPPAARYAPPCVRAVPATRCPRHRPPLTGPPCDPGGSATARRHPADVIVAAGPASQAAAAVALGSRSPCPKAIGGSRSAS